MQAGGISLHLSHQTILHRAPWLLPVSSPPIPDGAIAVSAEKILAVGPWQELQKEFSTTSVVDHPDCCIMPGLVNAHIHTELSHLRLTEGNAVNTSFTEWIEELVTTRQNCSLSEEAIVLAAHDVLKQQWQDGVYAVADIGNTFIGLEAAREYPGLYFHFHEYVGLTQEASRIQQYQLEAEPESSMCTAHAPYSVHKKLLFRLKSRAQRLGYLFPIHTAETKAENELAREGNGEFRAFLEKRAFWDGSFTPTRIDNSGAVQYLHQVGVLDEKTLCVHCVHVSDDEVSLLAGQKCGVCLCPGSNAYLGVGKAPVSAYLKQDILPALGTDSLASNPILSIWREMRLLHTDHSEIDPAVIITMATLGGARALAVDTVCGSLERGKTNTALLVKLLQNIRNVSQLYDFLINNVDASLVSHLGQESKVQ